MLRSGLRAGTAADLLSLHCGDDVYASLVIGCGWKRQEVEKWMIRSLEIELFAPEPKP